MIIELEEVLMFLKEKVFDDERIKKIDGLKKSLAKAFKKISLSL